MQTNWASKIGSKYNKLYKYLTGPWKPISLPLNSMYIFRRYYSLFWVLHIYFLNHGSYVKIFHTEFFHTFLWHQFQHLCNGLIFFHVPQQTGYKTSKVLVACSRRYRLMCVCVYIYAYVMNIMRYTFSWSANQLCVTSNIHVDLYSSGMCPFLKRFMIICWCLQPYFLSTPAW